MGLWGDIEHVVGDIGSLVDKALGELETLGIGASAAISWLVKFLIEAGEDPVAVISQLSGRITSLGGDPFSTLEQLAEGVMTYGLTGFAQKKVNEALTPLRDTLSKSTTQSQAVASVHQTTLSTMKIRLDALQTGGNTTAWQGMSVQAMNTSFGNISGTLNGLTAPMDTGGAQAALNYACGQALQDILVVGEIVMVCEIIVTAILTVVGLAADGVGALVGLGAGVGLMEATLELLMFLIGADLAIWLLGTIAIYVVNVVQQHMAMSKAKSSDGSGTTKPSKAACSKALKLMKEVDRLEQKANKNLNPKRLAELKQKLKDGTLTSDDLPGTLQREFPGELKGLTIKEIQALCKGV